MTREELFERLLWVAPIVLAAVVARLFHRAFGVGEPPADAAERALWTRRFRFMVASELCSVPVLAIAAVLLPSYLDWSREMSAVAGLVFGTIGYATFAAAARAIFNAWVKGLAKGVGDGR
ncbi:MAG: hypothetical protein INF91_10690 [Alphaproteobacteria bacterium]|nr:hypothetical protein [Alphaproteobacteria bacterium]